MSNYQYQSNLTENITVSADGIVSRTVQVNDKVKTLLLSLDAGQQLTEHKAPLDATLQVLRGEGVITLDGIPHDGQTGSWAYMPAGLPHSIEARSPLVLLLTMIKSRSA